MLGASGGIGQPLSLLLKNSPVVSRLSLYDIAHTPGVAADLSHIETRANVKGMVSGWGWTLCMQNVKDPLRCVWCLAGPALVLHAKGGFTSAQRQLKQLFFLK